MSSVCRLLLVILGVLAAAGLAWRPVAGGPATEAVRIVAEPDHQPAHPAASHRMPAATASARLPTGERSPDGRASVLPTGPVADIRCWVRRGDGRPLRTADRRTHPSYLQYFPTAPPPLA